MAETSGTLAQTLMAAFYRWMKVFSIIFYKYRYYILFLFLLAILPPFYLKAQEYVPPPDLSYISEVPHPFQTDLIKKDTKEFNKVYLLFSFKYKTRASQEETMKLYREFFLSKGLKEDHFWDERNKGDIKFLEFKRGTGLITRATVGMYTNALDTDEVIYEVNVTEAEDALFLSTLTFKPAQPLKFMTPYIGANEFSRGEKKGQMGVSYLIPADTKDVIEFYLKDMPKHGWNLTARKDREGRYNLFVALTMGFSEQLPMKAEEYTPGIDVDVEGSTLIFERNKERCIITINKFRDTSDVLKELRINPAPLEKYGRIYFSVMYYEN
jgi:hypothetical protein